MKLPKSIDLLSNLSPLAPIYAGWRLKGLLWWYCWVCLTCDVMGYLSNQLNLPRLHANIFLLLEFLMISWHLLCILSSKIWQKAVSLIGIGAVGLTYLIYMVASDFQKPHYSAGACFYGIYIVLCIGVLYKVVCEAELQGGEASVHMIFSSAFLLYASGSMLMLLFKMHLSKSEPELMNQIWDLRNVLNIVKNFSIAYVFTLQKKQLTIAT